MPSLVALAFAAFLLYRLTTRLVDVELGRLAVLCFVGWPGIAFAASDARPYALAIFFVVASTLAVVRWLDTGHLGSLTIYVLLAALVVYAHYLFGLALVPQWVYAVVRIREGSTPVNLKRLLAVVGAIILATLPLLAQLLSLWGRRASLGLAEDASVELLAQLLVPPAVVGAVVLGGVLAASSGKIMFRLKPLERPTLVLLFVWLLFPLGALFIEAIVLPVRFLSLRYTLAAAPAAVLIAAWVMESVDPDAARRIVAAVFAILAVLALGGRLKADEDWRGAAAAVQRIADARTIVLAHPAFIESAQLDWFNDPERRSELLSPISYYPVPGRVVLLPYEFNDSTEKYLSDVLRNDIGGADRLVLLTRFPGIPYGPWLDGRLGPSGWTSEIIGDYGTIEVVEFSRSPTTP
jgi:mannosyltransferase